MSCSIYRHIVVVFVLLSFCACSSYDFVNQEAEITKNKLSNSESFNHSLQKIMAFDPNNELSSIHHLRSFKFDGDGIYGIYHSAKDKGHIYRLGANDWLNNSLDASLALRFNGLVVNDYFILDKYIVLEIKSADGHVHFSLYDKKFKTHIKDLGKFSANVMAGSLHISDGRILLGAFDEIGNKQIFYYLDEKALVLRSFFFPIPIVSTDDFNLVPLPNGEFILSYYEQDLKHAHYLFNPESSFLQALIIPEHAWFIGDDEKNYYFRLSSSWRQYKKESVIGLPKNCTGNDNCQSKLVFACRNASYYIQYASIYNDKLAINCKSLVKNDFQLVSLNRKKYISKRFSELSDGGLEIKEAYGKLIFSNAHYDSVSDGFFVDISKPTLVKGNSPSNNISKIIVQESYAKSGDGTMVPYILLKKQNARTNAPAILDVYGGRIQDHLTPSLILGMQKLWLDRGGILIFGGPRGGKELGDSWARAGKHPFGMEPFEDIRAIVDDARKVFKIGNIGITGGSHGGYLSVGAALTYPKLFSAVAAINGVYDFSNYRKTHPTAFKCDRNACDDLINKASPINQVSSSIPFTSFLLISGKNDQRVNPVTNTRNLAKKLKEYHQKYYYIEYPDEGHSIENNYFVNQAMIYEFFSEILYR